MGSVILKIRQWIKGWVLKADYEANMISGSTIAEAFRQKKRSKEQPLKVLTEEDVRKGRNEENNSH